MMAGFPIDMQCDPRDANRTFVNNYGGGNFLAKTAAQPGPFPVVDTPARSCARWLLPRTTRPTYTPARGVVFLSAGMMGEARWSGMSYGVAALMGEARWPGCAPTLLLPE